MLIAVSAWSFHAELYGGRLHMSEVPFRSYELGFRAVELLDQFLWPAPPNRLARWLGRKARVFDPHAYDRQTLLRVKMNRVRSGTQLVAWGVESDLTAAGAARDEQRRYLAQAIAAARWLGAPLMRLTLGGEQADRAGYDRAVDLLSSVLPVAIASGVKLAIENHGGLSADPQVLIDLATHFGSPFLGVCVDVGNFAGDAAEGVRRLAPHALHVHAKAWAFDARGEETSIDYAACLAALRAAGYDGVISIEYEGDGEAAAGVRAARRLIERHWRA